MTRARQAGSALVLGAVLWCVPAPALAQPAASNPPPAAARTLTFDVSPDHAVIDPSGPRVLKYIVDFTPVDGGTARTLDLGKPAAPDGTISVPLAQAQLPDGLYLATVRVVGSTMTTESATVGPFQIGKARRQKSSDTQTLTPANPAPAGAAPAATPAPQSSPADAERRKFWKRIYSLIVG